MIRCVKIPGILLKTILNMRNLFKFLSQRLSITLINQLSILIALPLITSKLSIDFFGQISVVLIFIQIGFILSDYGTQNSSIEEWNKLRTRYEQNEYFTKILFLKLFIISIFLSFFLLLNFFKLINVTPLIAICAIPSIIFGGLHPLWFYQVEKSLQDLIIPTLLSRVIYLIIIFFLVTSNETAYWVILAQGLSFIFVFFYSYMKIYRVFLIRLVSVNFLEIYSRIKNNFAYLLTILQNNQSSALWGLGLSFFGSNQMVAIYSLGDQFYRAAGIISGVCSQALHLFSFENRRASHKSIIIFLLVTLILGFLGYVAADKVITIFFPKEYETAISIIKVMIVAWTIQSFIKYLGYPLISKIFNVAMVHKITIMMFIIHFISFAIWVVYFSSVKDFVILFVLTVIFHLISYFFLILLNLKKL